MPDFEITAPNGQRFVVTAPEGASQDEVLRYAQQNMPGAAPATAGQSFVQGLTDPVQGGAQLLANSLPRGAVDAVNDATSFLNRQPVIGPAMRALGMVPATPEDLNRQTVEREQQYQAARAAGGDSGMDLPRMAGALVPAVAMAVATRTPQTLLGAVGYGAAQGAAQGALQPVTDPENFAAQKAGQIGLGGALGAVGGPVGHVIGRAIAPHASEQARALYEAGVRLTPGQAAGGAVRRVEDALTSAPLVGDVVRGAQREALDTFNTAVANRVLQPLGATVPRNVQPGRDLVEFVDDTISRAYDGAISRAQPFAPDRQFAQDLAGIGQQFMTPRSRAEYNSIVRDRVLSRLQAGQISPAEYQTIRSDLGLLGRRYGSSQAPADQEMAEGFRALQGAFDSLLARTNPQIARELRAANAAFAGFVRMSDAASRQGSNNGVFSAAQLSGAVRANDRSVRRGAYARGDAMLQDLTDAGRAVLPSSVPDSGTAGRLATLAGIGGVLGGQMGVPAGVLAGGGGALAAYTPLGRQALAALLLARRPAPVQAAGDLIAASGAPVTVPLGSMLLSPPP